MAYTASTVLPVLSEIAFFQWSQPTAQNPRLSAPVSSTATTLKFTSAPLDHDGNVITEAFLMGIRDENSYVETVYVPAGALSVDGKTATGVVRGVYLEGLDWKTGSSTYAVQHKSGDAVFCNVSGVIQALNTAAISGQIATGGAGITIGTDALGTVTLYRSTGVGTKQGFLRWETTGGKTQYSNDGVTWNDIDNVVAGSLVVVTGADTTPGNLDTKVTVSASGGAVVTKSVTNPGADERLNIDVALNAATAGVDEHAMYTPAYLTGGNSAESLFNNWLAVLDGEFAITIDGVAREITAIDFTGVTSMNDVAAKLQTEIRAVTSGSETVAWSTNHFVITSGNTTSSSAITVTSTVAAPAGTDISGAGAANWMDADTGNGVVTAAVRDDAADAGKLALLDAAGYIDKQLLDQDLISNETLAAKGDLIGASAASTVEILPVGSDNQVLVADSGETSGLKYQTFKKGVGDNGLGWASYPLPYVRGEAVAKCEGWRLTGGALGTAWYLHFITADDAGVYTAIPDMLGTTGSLLSWNALSSGKFEIEIYARFTTGGTPANQFTGFGMTQNSIMDIDTNFSGRVVVGIDDTGNLVINSANGAALTSAVVPGTFAVWRKYNLVFDYPNNQVLLYVDDALTNTVTATRPSGASGGMLIVSGSAGAAGRNIYAGMPVISYEL